MEKLRMYIREKANSTHVRLEGNLTLMDALEFKSAIHWYIKDKNLFIDLTKLNQMDINGLNGLLTAKIMCDHHAIDLTILVQHSNPLFSVLEKTKFQNQLTFRNSIRMEGMVA